jgi:hypothetical protein
MSPRSIPVGRLGAVAQLGERLNRTQEADGSIPFSSTKSLTFFFLKGRLKRFAVESFQTQEASRPPSSTVITRRCCAPATASGFTEFWMVVVLDS